MKSRKRNTKTKKTRRSKRTRRVPFWAGIASLGCVCIVLAAGYLAQVSATASKGYAIRSLQSEIDELKEESELLEFEVAKEKSMDAVEEKVSEMGMVPAGAVQYMHPTDPIVAKR